MIRKTKKLIREPKRFFRDMVHKRYHTLMRHTHLSSNGDHAPLVRTRTLAIYVIVAPFLLATLYFAFIAQPRYVSESQVIVKRAQDNSPTSGGLGALLGGLTTTGKEDALLLQQYIHSPDMLAYLERQISLSRAFNDAKLDWFYQLSPTASKEDKLAYYRARVHIQFDDKTALLTLRTEGFSPAFSQKLNCSILRQSEQFINELSHKIIRSEMVFAQQEINRRYQELNQAKEKLLAYQNRHGQFDPMAQAQATGQLIAELQAKQAALETELRTLTAYLQPDAPQVIATQQALSAVKVQINEEKAKLAAPKDRQLNRTAAQFQELRAQVDFQTDLYKLALTAFEKNRIDATRNLKSLAIITAAQLPEEAEYPRIAYTLISLLLICGLLFGLIKLAISIIEDHRI